jgi:hypothetical protein
LVGSAIASHRFSDIRLAFFVKLSWRSARNPAKRVGMSSVITITGAMAFIAGLIILGLSGNRSLRNASWPKALGAIVMISGIAIELYAVVIH